MATETANAHGEGKGRRERRSRELRTRIYETARFMGEAIAPRNAP